MKANSIKNKLISVLILFSLLSCEKEEPILSGSGVSSHPQNLAYLDGLMQQWYLWNNELPTYSTESFDDQNEMLAALLNKQDKWSHIQDKAEYEAYYNSGQVSTGDEGYHGIYLQYATESDLFIRFSYPGSNAYNAGLTRGTKINAINGFVVGQASSEQVNESMGENKKGVTNTFDITIPSKVKYVNGEMVEVSAERDTTIIIEKEDLIVNPILLSEVVELPNGKKVGHIVFKSFIVTAEEALENTFASFKQAGVSEVILDMRYNGGGRVNIANQIGGYLAPASADGKTFFKYIHNNDRTEENENQNLDLSASNLNLNRVFIIADGGTASSSELVINCLKPYMDVHVLGQQTYGKPVGSYGFENNDFIYSIISLRILNANNEGNYFEGIPVEKEVLDDVKYDWDDIREPTYYQALYKIQNGAYDESSSTARLNNSNLDHKNRAFKKGEDKERLFNEILMIKK